MINGNLSMSKLNSHLETGSISDANIVLTGFEEYAKSLVLDNRAIIEFYDFSIKFFDRVFGEDTTNRSIQNLPALWVPYPCGGWLRKLALPSMIPNRNNENNPQLNQNALQLVKLLSTDSKVIEILRKGYENFKLDFKLLPDKVKICINQLKSHKISSTSNHSDDLFQFVNTFNISKLSLWFCDPKVYSEINQIVSLPPFYYFLFFMIRYPTVHDQIFNPQYMADTTFQTPHKVKKNLGVVQLIQTNPYLVLLRHYFNYFLPRSSTQTKLLSRLSDEGEWFLRLLVEYWINTSNVVRFNQQKYLHMHMADPKSSHASSNLKEDILRSIHYSPLTTTVLDDNPPIFTTPTLQSIFLLLVHYLSDPAMPTLSTEAAELNSKILSKSKVVQSTKQATSTIGSPDSKLLVSDLIHTACPPTLQIIQQPLYDMLRTIFSRGDQACYRSLMFHQACQIWLLYLQPWAAVAAGNSNPNLKYTSQWDYYIASNLHFYTTLPILFFQILSKASLDLSDPDGPAFFNTLELMLKVFNGDLLNTIIRLSQDFNTWYSHELQVEIEMRNKHNLSNIKSYVSPLFGSNDSIKILHHAILSHHEYLYPDFTKDYFLSEAVHVSEYSFPILDLKKLSSPYTESIRFALIQFVKVTRQSIVLWLFDEFSTLFKEEKKNSLHAALYSNSISQMIHTLNFLIERKSDIHFATNLSVGITEDSLTTACTEYEWSPMVQFSVSISKLLNKIMSLPRDPDTVNYSFFHIFNLAFEKVFEQNPLLKIMNSFRFNFRFMSNITLLTVISMVFAVWFISKVVSGEFEIRFILTFFVTIYLLRTILNIYNKVEAEENTNKELQIRDELTGKLTAYGRQQLLAGKIVCNKEDIRYAGDSLKTPLASYEYSYLGQIFIQWSRILNSRYNLPRIKETVTMIWRDVFIQAWKNRMNQNPIFYVMGAFRFNLRILANKSFIVLHLIYFIFIYIFHSYLLNLHILSSIVFLTTLLVVLEYYK